MTRQLWRTLQHPPQGHPLFCRTLQRAEALLPAGGCALWLVAGLGAALLALAAPALLLVLAVYGLLLLPALLLVFGGTLFGGYLALSVAASLSAERRCGRYALLQMMPAGVVHAALLISAGCAHRANRLGQAHHLARLTTGSIAAALGLVVGFLYISLRPDDARSLALGLRLLTDACVLLCACAVLYWDHIQSALTGCLVGMLMAGGDVGLESRAAALLLFGLLQTGTVLLSLGLLRGTADLSHALLPDALLAPALAALLAAGLIYLLRDALIRLLWRGVLHQLEATTTEWHIPPQALLWQPPSR